MSELLQIIDLKLWTIVGCSELTMSGEAATRDERRAVLPGTAAVWSTTTGAVPGTAGDRYTDWLADRWAKVRAADDHWRTC